MIERVSELPFFGPEEQLRKFINQSDDTNKITETTTQQAITQTRIGNIDDMLQQMLIWSYGQVGVDDAYFYWDWCPSGDSDEYNKWQIERWEESQDNLTRDVDRTFSYRDFVGFRQQRSDSGDEMPIEYDASTDVHAREQSSSAVETLDKDTLRHNVMRSFIEVSEWLGDGAADYGSHNEFVSRKMSLCWLFDAIRALINYKLVSTDKYAQEDIVPLDVDGGERFLDQGEQSPCGIECGSGDDKYSDSLDLNQIAGRCAEQKKVRSSKPNENGTLKVRGNEWHYGERADFYTHNSFMGECRFFHNVKFLGQATFDKEINGTAIRARWSGDLAEMYESDSQYEPGTLVMFGGEKEIMKSDGIHVNAIVTTKPGVILNGDEKKDRVMVGIALTGRVPVKVVGVVHKLDKLVAASGINAGCARARRWYEFWKRPIGIALGCNENGKVECATKMEF